MNINFLKSLSLLPVFAMSSGMLSADCLPSAPSGYTAPFTMVTLKNYATNQYASYAHGLFTTSDNTSLFVRSETYSSSGATQLFSDRGFDENCSGLICTYQPFDANKADSLGVSITKTSYAITGSGSGPTYSGTLTLESWGNTKINFTLTCDATTGILYGRLGGDSHVVITIGTPVAPPQ
jgi:hypothetical protein